MTALGVTEGELRRLAEAYEPGAELNRVPVSHFSPLDFNYVSVPEDADAPEQPDSEDPIDDEGEDDACEAEGSIIECENQVLRESIPLAGTPFRLARTGTLIPRTIEVPLLDATLPPRFIGARVRVDVAGRTFEESVDCLVEACVPGRVATFGWDGRDRFGNIPVGRSWAKITRTYEYPASFAIPDAEPGRRMWARAALFPGPDGLTRLARPTVYHRLLRGPTPEANAVGGWTLSGVHVYDPATKMLHRGDGTRRRAQDAQARTRSVPNSIIFGDFAPLPDGGFVTCSNDANAPNVLTRLFPDGQFDTIGPEAPNGCGNLETAPDGTIYSFSVQAPYGIYRRERSGAWTHVACAAPGPDSGDDGPATLATCDLGNSAVWAAGVAGSLYLATNRRIRKVDPTGTIRTVLGNGTAPVLGQPATFGDGGPALLARVGALSSGDRIVGMAVGPDGSVIFEDSPLLRRMRPDGVVERLAGNYTNAGFGPEPVGSLDARLRVTDIEVDRSGVIHFGETTGLAWNGRTATTFRALQGGAVVAIAGRQCPTCTLGGPAAATPVSGTMFGILDDGTIGYLGGTRLAVIEPAFPSFATEVLIPSEDGSVVDVFELTGRHLRTQDAETGVVLQTIAYDAAGRVERVTDRDGRITRVVRDGAGVPIRIEGPFGHVTTLTVGGDGLLTSVTSPDQEVHAMAYDPERSGLLVDFTKPGRAAASHFEYDIDGRLIRDTNAKGDAQTLSRAQTDDSYTVTMTSPLGRVTRVGVDPTPGGAKVRSFTNAAGLVSSTSEQVDEVRRTTHRDGTVTTREYAADPRWGMLAPYVRSETIAFPGGPTRRTMRSRTVATNSTNPFSFTNVTETTWINPPVDSSGNPTGAAAKSVRTYARTSRTETWTTPLGRTGSRVLDAKGRTSVSSPPGVTPTTMSYDLGTGRLASTTQGARTQSWTYGADGNVATTVDALGDVSTWGWSPSSRLVSATRPDLETTTLTFGDDGNLSGITPPGRPTHGFEHDVRDLLTSYAPPAAAPGGPTTYEFDADRDLSLETRPGGAQLDHQRDPVTGRRSAIVGPTLLGGAGEERLTWEYDGVGRVAARRGPVFEGGLAEQSLLFTYAGSLKLSEQFEGAVDGTVSWTFDNHLRLATERVAGDNLVSYTYDGDSLLLTATGLSITREPATGRVTAIASTHAGHTIVELRGYDGFGGLASIDYQRDGASFFRLDFARDDLGRIVTKTETEAGVSTVFLYAYDLAGRLIRVEQDGTVVEEYEYDPNGNRLLGTNSGGTSLGEYDAQDRLVSYGPHAYAYGPNGELETRTGPEPLDLTTDVFGNLRTATTADADVDYVADPKGRRVERRVDGLRTAGWLWRSQLAPAAELDETGAVARRYVYTDGINVPDLVVDVPTGARWRLVKDHLGSVRRVVDVASGAIVRGLDFDSFGRILAASGDEEALPFGFAGGLWDAETGLVRFGAREYEPETGRWTNKDPIRFEGGDANIYAYAANDPVSGQDPEGRNALVLGGAAWFGGCAGVSFFVANETYPQPADDKTRHCYAACLVNQCLLGSDFLTDKLGIAWELASNFGAIEWDDVEANRRGIEKSHDRTRFCKDMCEDDERPWCE